MIINSLLDTDLYKLTMMQTVFHHFPEALVEYQFSCRTPKINLLPYLTEIQHEAKHFSTLKFTQEDLSYLGSFPFFKKDFLSFLQTFQLDNKHLVFSGDDNFGLTITGPWLHTILFEVPLLAIISEIYMQKTYPNYSYAMGKERLHKNMALVRNNPALKNFLFSDFGTRRRFSFIWQNEVIQLLHQELPQNFYGTSNVYFAKKFGLNAVGTMAHEYIQGCQAICTDLRASQKFAFSTWLKEYGDKLGIALSDTYNLRVFLQDFDVNLSQAFTGIRQDSGDPFKWGDTILAHYKKLGIDPKTKQLVFSDGLTFPLMIKLYNHFQANTKPFFGIGSNLTNDVGYSPIQIIIKMTECNGKPVAKITDDPSKVVCKDPAYLVLLKKIFGI